MFRDFFNGRYGIDTLGIVLAFGASILMGNRYTWIIGIAMLAYAIFRALSKNKNKRYQEFQKFNNFLNKLKPITDPIRKFLSKVFFSIQSRSKTETLKWKQRKQFVFINCPKCKKTLRLPRGKGKVQVTCPMCKMQFYKIS